MIFSKFLYWHSPEGTTIFHLFVLLALCCLFDSIVVVVTTGRQANYLDLGVSK